MAGPIQVNWIQEEQGWPVVGWLQNITAATLLNQSGIALDQTKGLTSIPPNWVEIDGYKEGFSASNSEIVRYFRGPWGSRLDFKTWVLGTSQNITSGQAGQLRRLIPAQEPECPWLYAVSCELVRGEGAIANNPNVVLRDAYGVPVLDGGGNTIQIPKIGYYDSGTLTDSKCCVYAVTYRDVGYEVRSDVEMDANPNLTELNRYVTRQEDFTLQNIQIPGRILKFVDGDDAGFAIPENAAIKLLPARTVTYTWHEVPDIPTDAWENCQGRINSAPFDVPALLADGTTYVSGYWTGGSPTGYGTGTLLLLAPKKEPTRTPTGRRTWRITYPMIYRPQGHNYFPDSTGSFHLATSNGTAQGRPVYLSADFAQLFTQPTPRKYQSAAA